MKKPFLIFLTLLASANALALTNAQVELCSNPFAIYALENECPPILSGGTPTATANGAVISGVTTTKTGTFRALLHDGSVTYDNSVESRDALLRQPGIRVVSSENPTIDWAAAGATGQWVTLIGESAAYEGNPVTIGPFNVVAGGSKWVTHEPGVYFGMKLSQYVDDSDDNYYVLKNLDNTLGNSVQCQNGGHGFKGMRIRFHWRDYENMLGDYSQGHRIIDGLLDWLTGGGCGGRPMGLIFQMDVMVVNHFADTDRGVPADMPANSFYNWVNDGGRRRQSYDAWSASSNGQQHFLAVWNDIATRYGSHPYISSLSTKVEGAFNPQGAGLPSFGPAEQDIFWDNMEEVMDLIRLKAPNKSIVWGANNYRVGTNEKLLTRWIPYMNATGAMGLSWPDTFRHDKPGNQKPMPNIIHHKYFPGIRGQYLMHGEWQRPQSVISADGDYAAKAWEACCDVYFPAGTDPNNFDPPESTNINYASTHLSPITSQASHPIDGVIDYFNNAPHGWVSGEMNCPTQWVADGYQCRKFDGTPLP